jgi:PAS domain S-box-containing protein
MTANATRVDCETLGSDACAYRVVAEQLPDVAVFVFDRDLRFELATGAAFLATGWRPEEILGHTVFELVPPDLIERYAGPYRAALAGERQSFEVQGWRKPDKVWAVDVLPIRGPDGAITGGMVFSTDVTERRRTERELRERRRQLAEAQRIARVGNWEWDQVSGTGSASAEWFRVVGVRPEDIPSPEAALGFVHPDDRPELDAAIHRATADGTPFEVEHRTILPNGQVRTVLVRGEGVRDEHGRVARLIGTNQDVTEARQAEEERQRLLARLYEVLEGQHQRLAVDLHDGHVQSLAAMGLTVDQVRLRLGPNAPAPVRELLDQLRDDLSDEVTSLRRTIGALRPLVLDQCGLVTAVHDLAYATRSRAALVDCSLSDRLGGERLDPDVETALFRVAQQALANVEQHAAARHVRIVLERSGSTVSLRVQDDGRGFDPAEFEVLAGHQGFGLTSMRERVQALGGQLAIETGRGGTCIEAWVPARPAPGPARPGPPARPR